MEKINKKTYILAAVSLLVITIAIYFLFVWQKKPDELKADNSVSEVKELKELELAKWPFITLTPTADGAEIIISIENMDEFERIEYELTYLADNPQIAGEKIQRGATGTDVNTSDKKYKKSLLLGTASRGVRSPDRGITDGKLVMHMYKGDIEYQSETPWVFEKIASTPITLKTPDSNAQIEIPGVSGKEYWVILADTLGLPDASLDFDIATVNLPVYGSFSIAPEFTKDVKVTLKGSGISDQSSLYIYNLQENKFTKATPQVSNGTLTTSVRTLGTFVTTK